MQTEPKRFAHAITCNKIGHTPGSTGAVSGMLPHFGNHYVRFRRLQVMLTVSTLEQRYTLLHAHASYLEVLERCVWNLASAREPLCARQKTAGPIESVYDVVNCAAFLRLLVCCRYANAVNRLAFVMRSTALPSSGCMFIADMRMQSRGMLLRGADSFVNDSSTHACLCGHELILRQRNQDQEGSGGVDSFSIHRS